MLDGTFRVVLSGEHMLGDICKVFIVVYYILGVTCCILGDACWRIHTGCWMLLAG
jgi:hypothetical protein